MAGASGTGKTTLLGRLLDQLPTDRSRVGVIKHTHHELDWHPKAKDSSRYWEAGAGAVVVVDPLQVATFTRVPAAPDPRCTPTGPDLDSESVRQTRSLLDACIALPASIEIVLAEGWSRSRVPKVWFTEAFGDVPPFDQVPMIRAIVSAEQGANGQAASAYADGVLPVYSRNDVSELAAGIWEWAEPVSELRETALSNDEARLIAPAS